eukprot:TRINITY_DN7470_c0_g1_i1.p1 TRINITY_DN7470_c0_g1~~TRINITY_DN7470_c0_g1_i1.p1  ORF type:complete len:184 (-),score=24.19 TRINITY_DN7470_c0_g1_i1:14-565(-)
MDISGVNKSIQLDLQSLEQGEKFGDFWEPGTYSCSNCGHLIFRSDDKFKSGSKWPTFKRPATEDSVKFAEDLSFGLRRTQILCNKCSTPLGHRFDNKPGSESQYRYLAISISLVHQLDSNSTLKTKEPTDEVGSDNQDEKPKNNENQNNSGQNTTVSWLPWVVGVAVVGAGVYFVYNYYKSKK